METFEFETAEMKDVLRGAWDDWRADLGIPTSRDPSRLIRLFAAMHQAHRGALRGAADQALIDRLDRIRIGFGAMIDTDLKQIVSNRLNGTTCPIFLDSRFETFLNNIEESVRRDGYQM